jgi:hypothetical protein
VKERRTLSGDEWAQSVGDVFGLTLTSEELARLAGSADAIVQR